MATVSRHHGHSRMAALPAPLVLAASLFAGLYIVALCLLWILDPGAEPGRGLIAVPVIAVLVLLATSAVERWPLARPSAGRELASTSRLLALVAVLLLVPAALINITTGEEAAADGPYVTADGVEARAITAACPPAALPGAGMADVAAASPHATAVDCVMWWGVARGTSDGTFAPDAVVTREQAASFLVRLVGASDRRLPRVAPDRFTDVTQSIHQANINRLADLGIMNGTGDATFTPAASVTRGQLAALLVRAHEYVTGTRVAVVADAFADDTGRAHELAIDRAATLGLLSGREDGTFGPDEPVTRVQLASFLTRALDAYVTAGAAQLPLR